VPAELTVSILLKGMIAYPSKNYLIDGFPRALDQALQFEAQVGEAQRMIFYDVSEETLIARCQERAKTSGRSDDNMQTLLERFRNFREQSVPVVEYYDLLGKVTKIDASGSVKEVYAQTKEALLPEVFSIVGPRGAGKSKLGEALAQRANMTTLNFPEFLKTRSLCKADDETKVQALVDHFVSAIPKRYLLEDFPQNEF